MCLVTRKDLQTVTACKFVISRRSRNALSGLVLSDCKFIDVLKTTLTLLERLR